MTETENEPPAWYDKHFQHQADVLEMALRFVWACQRQIHRFADGFGARPTIYWDFNKGIVAMANKTVRIAWAMLVRQEDYARA